MSITGMLGSGYTRYVIRSSALNDLFFETLLTILSCTLVLTPLANAAQASFSWNANTESTLSGYRLHYGTSSSNYASEVDVGNTTSYLLTGLRDDQTYYFALTAYNKAGLESAYSQEVDYTPTNNAPVAAAGTLSLTAGSSAALDQKECAWG